MSRAGPTYEPPGALPSPCRSAASVRATSRSARRTHPQQSRLPLWSCQQSRQTTVLQSSHLSSGYGYSTKQVTIRQFSRKYIHMHLQRQIGELGAVITARVSSSSSPGGPSPSIGPALWGAMQPEPPWTRYRSAVKGGPGPPEAATQDRQLGRHHSGREPPQNQRTTPPGQGRGVYKAAPHLAPRAKQAVARLKA